MRTLPLLVLVLAACGGRPLDLPHPPPTWPKNNAHPPPVEPAPVTPAEAPADTDKQP
jgi:hypothetical protein